MRLVKQAGILLIQTIGGLLAMVLSANIVAGIRDAIGRQFFPHDSEQILCEYCPDGGWLLVVIAALIGVAACVWLIGFLFGQVSQWWLPLVGALIGTFIYFIGLYLKEWLRLPSVFYFLPELIIPFFASLMHQLGAHWIDLAAYARYESPRGKP